MITKQQAITANEFHYEPCTKKVGPRDGITKHIETWRRNGQTQTWKTRPNEFRIPVKFGLYNYGSITERDSAFVHIASDCPLYEVSE